MFFERENLSVFLTNRKQELLPAAALACIGEEYDDTWSPGTSRSIEGGDSFSTRKSALWFGDSDTPTNILDILYDRIHTVVNHRKIFRIVEAGSGSYAKFFTGLNAEGTTRIDCGGHLMVIPDGEVVKEESGLTDLITSWGFIPGKHFEMVAVHGGEFRIEEQPGLKLITANIFDHIPAIKPGSVHLLFSFKTVYQSFGGMYALEYFDRLLADNGDHNVNGIGIVWPVETSSQIIFIDEQQNEISPTTIFSMAGVGYWELGSHAHWVTDYKPLQFPIHARLLLQTPIGKDFVQSRIVYAVDEEAMGNYRSLGGQINYVENSDFQKLLRHVNNIIDISS